MFNSDFFHMSIGAGLAISTLAICGALSIKMMFDFLFDIVESIVKDD
jgi:hypothetical protein